MKQFLRSSLVRLYWATRFRAGQPSTWLHEGLVRRRVNRRIAGSEDVWPVNWFESWLAEHHGDRRFKSGVSLGCGEGAFERSVVTMGLCQSMVGLDLSREAVRSASEKARAAGIDAIEYRTADMNRLVFEEGDEFEIAFFHQSIHHVAELESCVATVAQHLPADGFLYLDEYVGPSRGQWKHELLVDAQSVFDTLPASVKRRQQIELPVDWRDPSEAARSAEILEVVAQHFTIEEQRDYGGNLLAVIYPWLDLSRVNKTAQATILTTLLDAEDELLATDTPSYYSVVVATPRRNKSTGSAPV